MDLRQQRAKNTIQVIDVKTWKAIRSWPLAPCESPTGIAYDRTSDRIFVGCGKTSVVVDGSSGRSSRRSRTATGRRAGLGSVAETDLHPLREPRQRGGRAPGFARRVRGSVGRSRRSAGRRPSASIRSSTWRICSNPSTVRRPHRLRARRLRPGRGGPRGPSRRLVFRDPSLVAARASATNAKSRAGSTLTKRSSCAADNSASAAKKRKRRDLAESRRTKVCSREASSGPIGRTTTSEPSVSCTTWPSPVPMIDPARARRRGRSPRYEVSVSNRSSRRISPEGEICFFFFRRRAHEGDRAEAEWPTAVVPAWHPRLSTSPSSFGYCKSIYLRKASMAAQTWALRSGAACPLLLCSSPCPQASRRSR